MNNEMTLTEVNAAIAMSNDILRNSQDINNVLTTSKKVKAVFHTHYADMESGEFGIEQLIVKIMREHGAEFVKGVETTELRQIAIAGSMFISDIETEVQKRFTAGSIRYPHDTIKAYMSAYLLKNGKVGRIQLTNNEDKNRTCCRPRVKWYLIAE